MPYASRWPLASGVSPGVARTLSDVRLSKVQPLLIVLFKQRVTFPAASCPHSAYALGYEFLSCTRPPSPYQVHFGAPARPFFVVTTMTPFAASVPYSVAADGPFTISMSSISSGFSELRSEKFTSVPELSE